MSDPRRRFDPSELDLDLDHESAELLATARDLEAYAATGLAAPIVGFEERIMAAIAVEPMPRPVAGRGFVAAVRDAWASAFGEGRPLAVRAQAFALLLLLAVAVGSVGSVAVVGASRLLTPDVTPPPVLPSPSPLPTPSVAPTPSPTPSLAPSPTPSASIRPSPTETDEPSGTDDSGGGSGSGRSGDSSGPGSGQD